MTEIEGPDPDILGILTLHGTRGGYLARSRGTFTPNGSQGRWFCGCGAEGKLEVGERIVDGYRHHLAQVLTDHVHERTLAVVKVMAGDQE